MSGLEWSRPELWPWLLLAPVVWVGLWRMLRAGVLGRAVYGAPLRERVPSPAERAMIPL